MDSWVGLIGLVHSEMQRLTTDSGRAELNMESTAHKTIKAMQCCSQHHVKQT